MDKFPIDNLSGIDLNVVEGVGQPNALGGITPLPDELFNISLNRRGGYSPLGTAIQVTDTLGNLVTISEQVLGYDQKGLASITTSTEIRLFDGRDRIDLNVADVGDYTHIPTVGAYGFKNNFLVIDKDDVERKFSSLAPTITTDTTASLQEKIFYGVHYAAGRWITVGQGKAILISDEVDASIWQQVSGDDVSGATTDFRAISYGDGTWIAVGSGGAIFTSSNNGDSWNRQITPSTAQLYGIAHNGQAGVLSVWLAVGANGVVFRSTDNGITWSNLGNFASGVEFRDVAYGAGGWVAIEGFGGNGEGDSSPRRVMRSTDNGSSWTSVYNKNLRNWGFVTFENGTFVVGGWVRPDDTIISSVDGVGWSSTSLKARESPEAATYSGGVWMIGGIRIIEVAPTPTTGGSQWQSIGSQLLSGNYGVNGLASNAGVIVAVGTTDINSSTAAGFIRRTSSTGQEWSSISLEAGTYQVIAVTYINTNSGKLVIDVSEKDINSNGTSIMNVRANAALPSTYATDVYIRKLEATDIPEETEKVYSYADTLSANEVYSVSKSVIGDGIGDNGKFYIVGFSSSFSALYRGRLIATPSDSSGKYSVYNTDNKPWNSVSNKQIIITDTKWLNLASDGNIFPVSLPASNRITALVSITDGVLIFGENDCAIMYGDPALDSGGRIENFGFRVYPVRIGCDSGVQPAQINDVVFVVWRGRLYMVSDGQARLMSREIDLDNNPIVQVVADTKTSSVFVRKQGKQTFIYQLENQGWVNGSVSQLSDFLLPNTDVFGTRFILTDDKVMRIDYTNPADSMYITYYGLDLGDKFRRKMFVRIRVPVDKFSHSISFPPRLFYKLRPQQTEVADSASLFVVEGRLIEDEILFTLPAKMPSRTIDMRIELRGTGITRETCIEPPIIIEYVSRNEQR